MGFMRPDGMPAAALVVVLSALAGGLLSSQTVSTQDKATEAYRVYTAALAAIEQQYIEPVEASELVYGSIDGMLRTLDPHSSFLDPRMFASMRERQEGRYFGIGITIVQLNDDIRHVAV